MSNSTLENISVFDDQTTDTILAQGGDSHFLNDANALYEKTAASAGGDSSFGATFQNSGTFDLNGFTRTFTRGFSQYAGTVSLGGGTLGLSNNQAIGQYWLFGGMLVAGDGIILGGDLTNMGGTLDVTLGLFLFGNYDQWAGATLEFNPGCLSFIHNFSGGQSGNSGGRREFHSIGTAFSP